jgi:hypothetical protein
MKLFGKEWRDKEGRMIDGLFTRFRRWWLGHKLRTGKVPRGRTISSNEAVDALASSYRGIMGEIWGVLSCRVYRGGTGRWEDFGCISVQKITTAFRDRMVSCLQSSAGYPLDVFKYHAYGTGTTAEANTESALVTEVGSRVAGSQTNNGSNIYRTVATITPGAAYAVTEHGILSAATGGILMDRSVFAAINVGAGDSIQFTYDCTFNAEA